MAQGNIRIGVGFNVDKSGLNTIAAEFTKISQLADSIKINGVSDASAQLTKLSQQASQLSNIFASSYNIKLGTYDLEAVENKMKSLGFTFKEFIANSTALGPQASKSLNLISESLNNIHPSIQKTQGLLSKLGNTFMNTVRWSVASTALNAITGSIQKAWSFTKSLDTSLNDIQIVTEKSADEMARFAKQANSAAKALGATTRDYTKSALIYYQQGLSEEDVQARSQVTVKAANVTGQSASEVSEQLTAIWNGYKVSAAESEIYIDKVAKVAAATAADLEELSTGMSKVASAANATGVDIDQLNAQLATIVSVTRQDSNVVGTALKTIFSRMGDLAIDGEDEFGVKLGDVSSQLQAMGIQVLDAQGQMRDMGTVIEEVAAKWDTWTSAQQQAAAVAIAGKRQYNNLIALFENWDMYKSAKATSQDSAGTLQKQNEIYLDSIEAKLNKLTASAESFYIALFDNEGAKDLIENLTTALDIVGDLTTGVGGLKGTLLSFGGLLTTKVIAPKFGSFIGQQVKNIRLNKAISRQEDAQSRLYRDALEGNNSQLSYIGSEDFFNEKTVQLQIEQYQKLGMSVDEAKAKIQWQQLKEAQGAKEVLQLQQFLHQNKNKLSQKEIEDTKVIIQSLIDRNKQTTNLLTKEQELQKQAIEKIEAVVLEKDKKIQEIKEKILETTRKQIQAEDELAQKRETERHEKEQARLEKEQTGLDQDKEDFQAKEAKTLEILRRQIRTDDGRRFGGEDGQGRFQIAYNGTTSRGGAQTPEDLAQRAEKARAELEYRSKEIKSLSSLAISGKGESLDIIREKALAAQAFQSSGIIDFSTEPEQQHKIDLARQKMNKQLGIDNVTGVIDTEAAVDLQSEETRKAIQDYVALIGREFKKALDENKEALGNLSGKNSLGTQKKDIDKKEKSLAKSQSVEKKKHSQEEKRITALKKNQEERIKKIVDSDQGTEEAIKNIEEQFKQQEDAIKEGYDAQISQVDEKVQELNENMGEVGQGVQEELKKGLDIQATTELFTQVTGSIMQVAGAISAIQNLGSIWNDEDLSTGEKILATTGALFSVLSAVPGVISTAKALQAAYTITKKADVVATGAQTVATQTKIAADIAEQAVNWPKLLITLAIVAAVTILVSLTYALVKAYNKEADAAKNSAERAEELKTALADTKAAYEDLKQTIEDYKGAKDALSELTKGTTEWKEAVMDINTQALELLNTYPELAKYMSKVDGVITFSDEGFDQILENQYNKVLQAQSASLQMTQIARDAQIELDAVETAREAKYYAYDGADILSQASNDQIREIAEKLSDEAFYSQAQFTKEIKSLGYSNDNLIKALWENKESLQQLSKSIDADTAQRIQENSLIYQSQLEAQGVSAEDAAVYGGMIAAYDQDSEAYKQEYEAELAKAQEEQGSKDLIKEWAKLNNIELTNDQIKGEGGGNFKYWDATEKEWKTINYKADQVFEQVAKARQQNKNIEEDLEKVKTLYNNISKDRDEYSKNAISAVLASNGAISATDLEDYSNATIAELEDVYNNFADELTEIQKTALKETIDNLNDYRNNLGTKLNWYDNGRVDADGKSVELLIARLAGKNNWSEVVNDQKNYNTQDLANLGNRFTDIIGATGEVGYNNVADFINSLGEKGNIETISNIFDNINWESENLIKEVTQAFNDAGVELDFTDKTVSSFIWSIRQMGDAAEYTAEKNKKVLDVLNGLAEYGDRISEEDYNALYERLGNAADEYFTQMSDGTYALSVAAGIFKEKADAALKLHRETALQEIRDKIISNQNSKQSFSTETKETAVGRSVGSYTESQIQTFLSTGKIQDDQGNVVIDLSSKLNIDENGNILGIKKGATLKESEMELLYDLYLDVEEDAKKSGASTGTIGWVKTAAQRGGWAGESGKFYEDDFDRFVNTDGATSGELALDSNKGGLGGNYYAQVSGILGDVVSIFRNAQQNTQTSYYTDASQAKSALETGHKIGALSNEFYSLWSAKLEEDDAEKYLKKNSPSEASEFEKAYSEAFNPAAVSEQDKDNYVAEAVAYLQEATSQEDYNQRLQTLGLSVDKDGKVSIADTDSGFSANLNLSDKQLEQIVSSGESGFKINEEIRAIEKYESAVETVESSISRLQDKLSELQDLQSVVFGEAVVDNLKLQAQELQKQLVLLQRKKELQEQEAQRLLTGKTDRTTIDANTDAGYALSGLLTQLGYAGALDLESLYEEYGVTSIAELISALEEKVYANNAGFDELDQLLDTMGETISDAVEAEIRAKVLEISSKNLEAIDVAINLVIDKNSFTKTYNDFLKSISDNEFGESATSALLGNFSLAKSNIAALENQLEELNNLTIVSEDKFKEIVENGGSAEGYITKADYQAKKQEILNSLMEEGLSQQEAYAALEEQVVNYQESLNSAYSDYVAMLEESTKLLQYQADLHELLYGEGSADMTAYYAETVSNANAAVEQALAAFQSSVLLENDPEAYLTAADNYMSSLVAKGQAYADQYANTLSTTFRDWADSVGMSTEAKQDWDWMVADSEEFLDDIDAAYELSALTRKYDQSINANTSLSAQKSLNKLREEEMKLLREKDRLTQYDIDRANKRLELEQARIALEEAQANKNTMRLMRGADGTYSYQYVADSAQVEEKMQAYEDAQREYIQISEDAAKEAMDNIYSLYEEWEEALDGVTDPERIAEINATFTKRMQDNAESALGVVDMLKSAVNDFSPVEGEAEDIFGWLGSSMFDALDSIMAGDFGGIENLAAKREEANVQIQAAADDLDEFMVGYKETLATLETETLNEIEAIKSASEAIEGLKNSLVDLKTELDANLSSINGKVVESGDINLDGWELEKKDDTQKWKFVSAETGMYTGEWGDSGKFAMLHEKELVLNQADTANILKAVDIVRYLNNLPEFCGDRLFNAASEAGNGMTVDQNVHIEASFPNVNSREEIEAAFEELVNAATQHVFKNSRG